MNTSQVTVSAPWQPWKSSTDLHGTFACREAARIFISMFTSLSIFVTIVNSSVNSHTTLFSSLSKIFSVEKRYLTTWIMRVPNITFFQLLTTEKQPFRHRPHARPCVSVCVNLCIYVLFSMLFFATEREEWLM